ncbi:hypothetical protein A2Z22_02405 [Candidatus Woesebacteria bacterium RBG_16_34_12]|uniref:Uncharacterized protein n=1 Tax=Candidatus Woesebacteria bacterium RBG_16_34_12 TaxID=1802480 RepID=A0A1F7X9C2_9BACT|nr:MAG: hypothetical protein A2Z22_02405 [Candidatus Woesebacteria bacterium RBG_16_34_12]
METLPNQPKEVTREKSPERFLQLFEKVSLMSDQGLKEAGSIPRNAVLGGVVGAIVIGSCTDPKSKPKDLDIFIILERKVNPRAHEYVAELRMFFDLSYSEIIEKFELGRLDCPEPISTDSSEIHPSQIIAIRNCQNPLIYAFNRAGALKVSTRLSCLKSQ